jgi:apolipoprotein D and lipocalin family protein
MRRALIALALLGALGLAPVALGGCNGEPPLQVAQNVDLSKFSGKWYEIARLPRTTQTDCHGTTAFYTQNSDGTLTFVNQCNVGAEDGPINTVSMSASIPDPAVPAKLALDIAGFVGNYWILEVDSNYEYAVIGHPSRLYFWVLSRNPTLDPSVMQGITTRATANHFDMSQLEYTPQPPPEDRTTSDTPIGNVPQPMTTGCSVSAGAPVPAGSPAPWGAVVVAAATAALLRRRRPAQC